MPVILLCPGCALRGGQLVFFGSSRRPRCHSPLGYLHILETSDGRELRVAPTAVRKLSFVDRLVRRPAG